MSDRLSSNPADYIMPLNINKLEGRMMYLPAPKGKSRDILLVPGHHGMLERWWSLSENLNDYGSVTVPDLPGFGGMDSFYTIGLKPTIDSYADYLAAFIKLRFKRKKITVVGISFGFVVVTRMLQLYPELTKKVDMLVSLVGFMHRDDFVYSPAQQKFIQYFTRLLATKPMVGFQKAVLLNRPTINFIYNHAPNSKTRQFELGREEFEATIDFEANLWKINDVRTHWLTTSEFINIDNCGSRIDLQVIHVVSKVDHYFNNDVVKEHMLVVFSGYKRYLANGKYHTPSVIADKKGAGVLLPTGLRRLLDK